MSLTAEVLAVLDEVLSLNGRSATFGPDTYLRGAVPELDSMAVVSLISALEDRFGFVINDDELSSDTFSTVGSLVQFVDRQTTS
jgi:acyl carrier protein